MKPLEQWIREDVDPHRNADTRWVTETFFFRDPVRPLFNDPRRFYAPADGVILYQRVVDANDPIVDLKGVDYSLRDALRKPTFDRRCLVIGIFMTMYDVHINRIPYAGRLTYEQLAPLRSRNRPMLAIEQHLCDELKLESRDLDYLHQNQRMVSRVWAPGIRDEYFLLQLADYDVDCITPFDTRQRRWWSQNKRFSAIRYGSQVDLIIPLSPEFEFVPLLPERVHVEAGMDALVEIRGKNNP